MRKVILFLILSQIYLVQYSQIIDHNCTKLGNIPLYWINQAKTSLHIAFEHTSHGEQITEGMKGLYNWKGNTYEWNDGGLNGALDINDHGITGGSNLGDPDWTSWASSTRTYLNNPSNSDINVVMWAWCAQLSIATESNVNTYLSLMSALESDFPDVKFVYMTCNLDGTGVSGNLNVRNEQIRNYCKNNNKILYDFADIESYDPDGNYYLNRLADCTCLYDSNGDGSLDKNWAIDWENSHTYNVDWYFCISPHTEPLNANMKAYAAWWLWARLAGWSGTTSSIPVTDIAVSGQGGATTISTDGGSLQLLATVLPANATNKTVTWSIISGSAYATIGSSTGILTAVDNGSVTVRATATDGTNVNGSMTVTITGQTIPVSSITVTGTGGATTISTDGGTLQLTASVLPANATNKTVTWSITSGSAYATIGSSTGILTAVDNGLVTVRATAADGSGVFGTTTVTISNQVIPVTSITVSGGTTITTDGGTLQLTASVLPANATNKTVTWSITGGSAYATINASTGLLTAVDNGSVTVRATAADGSGVFGTTTVTISNQVIPVISITVSGGTTITTDGGTLQLTASVLPANATNKTVTWSITSGSAYATINASTGLLTSVDNGSVTVRATAADGSGVFGTTTVTISNQVIPVTSITVSGGTTITTDGGTLQLTASALPANATNKTVTWSITSGSAYATIGSSTGILTAVDNGLVTVRATAADGSGVFGTTTVTISNQVIPVTSITVSGGTSITTDGGTLQLTASVLPANATNKTVTWSITSGSAYATINSSTGLLTAVENGSVTVRASAADGSGIFGTTTVTISNQVIPVTSITVSGGTAITTDGGTLQLTATVMPANATNKTVTWSITSGSVYATINSSTGLLTAVDNGSVTVRATAVDGSGIFGTITVTISNQVIPVVSITVSGAGGVSLINSIGGTLQLSSSVLPSNANNQTVSWTISNGTGQATINSSGVVTAVSNGTVTARATANDGSGVYGTMIITISTQIIPVSSITISGGTAIATDGGTLQLTASVLPANATNKTVTWSISSGTEFASINSSTGVLTAVDNGSITVRATAADGSGVFGAVSVLISNQVIPVSSITISGGIAITTDNGTLQLASTVLPSNATNKTVTWSITSGSTYATINTTSGLITAIDNGSVTVRAAATDGSGVTVSTTITISGQVIPVSSITVTGAAGLSLITSIGGTLQLSALVLPANATNQTVSWSMSNSTGQATISSTGLVTAVASGTVTARATANDGSNVYGTLLITISSQAIPATGITVTGASGATLISSIGGTLQLAATISPSNATIQAVTWSVTNGTGQATISSTGLVTAVASGTVTARATANDGSNVYGTLPITISNEMVAVTGIIVTGAAGKTEISSIGGTLQLIATITPSNATNQNVTWSVINVSGHATINSSGLVTAVSNGFVTVSATANDGSGATGTIDVTINENIDEPLTAIVHENEIRIPLQESYLGCKISLYDIYGRMMSTKFVDNNLSIFDISSFHSGLYMVVLSDKVILRVVKVIIQ